MGLDTTHGCWNGAYSAFYRWRIHLAEAAGLPPLKLMEGFFRKGEVLSDPFAIASIGLSKEIGIPSLDDIYRGLPIKWKCLKPDILHELLWHSDCEGDILWEVCSQLANRLVELLPNISEEHQVTTKRFIKGLLEAYSLQENVEFH